MCEHHTDTTDDLRLVTIERDELATDLRRVTAERDALAEIVAAARAMLDEPELSPAVLAETPDTTGSARPEPSG